MMHDRRRAVQIKTEDVRIGVTGGQSVSVGGFCVDAKIMDLDLENLPAIPSVDFWGCNNIEGGRVMKKNTSRAEAESDSINDLVSVCDDQFQMSAL